MPNNEEKEEVVYICPHCFKHAREYFEKQNIPEKIKCPNCEEELTLKDHRKTIGTYASDGEWWTTLGRFKNKAASLV